MDEQYHSLRYDNNGTLEGIQVDSAIRDENGLRISTGYGKKVETFNLIALGEVSDITIRHTLGDIPSAVQVYLYDGEEYEAIATDVHATGEVISIHLTVPLAAGTKYRVKAII